MTLTACGAPPRLAPLPLGPPGVTAVLLETRLAWPDRLREVQVFIDGARWYSSTPPLWAMPIGPPPGILDRRWVASVRLAPGDHLLAVRARLFSPCGVATLAGSSVVVHAAHVFAVGTAPASLAIALGTHGVPGRRLEHRVAATFRARGARLDPPAPTVVAPPAFDCDTLEGLRADRCREAAAFSQAMRERDVTRAWCHGERLAESDVSLADDLRSERSWQRHERHAVSICDSLTPLPAPWTDVTVIHDDCREPDLPGQDWYDLWTWGPGLHLWMPTFGPYCDLRKCWCFGCFGRWGLRYRHDPCRSRSDLAPSQ